MNSITDTEKLKKKKRFFLPPLTYHTTKLFYLQKYVFETISLADMPLIKMTFFVSCFRFAVFSRTFIPYGLRLFKQEKRYVKINFNWFFLHLSWMSHRCISIKRHRDNSSILKKNISIIYTRYFICLWWEILNNRPQKDVTIQADCVRRAYYL